MILNIISIVVSLVALVVAFTKKGKPGESIKGEPFKYSDFTQAQLNALKVKGDPFKFSDFTPAQLESLKVKGEDGKNYVIVEPAVYEKLKGEIGETLDLSNTNVLAKGFFQKA